MTIVSEDQDDEQDFREGFADPTSAFRDLLAAPQDTSMEDSTDAALNAEGGRAAGAADWEAAGSDAVCSQQTSTKFACICRRCASIPGGTRGCYCIAVLAVVCKHASNVQEALVALKRQRTAARLHAHIVTALALRLNVSYGAALPQRQQDRTQAHHALRRAGQRDAFAAGAALLRLAGGAVLSQRAGAVDASVDGVATGALVTQLAARAAALDAATGGSSRSPATGVSTRASTGAAGGHKGEGVDMREANMDEKLLVVQPVTKLATRVAALLARFEAQPMLLQLQTICNRILGMIPCGPSCRSMPVVQRSVKSALRRSLKQDTNIAIFVQNERARQGLDDENTTADFLPNVFVKMPVKTTYLQLSDRPKRCQTGLHMAMPSSI